MRVGAGAPTGPPALTTALTTALPGALPGRGVGAARPRAARSQSSARPGYLHPWTTSDLLARSVALPLCLALVVRLAIAFAFHGTALVGDEGPYAELGARWAETGRYHGDWAPGYPAFHALCQVLFGSSALAGARVLQVLLALWTGAWLADAAGRIAGRRAAAAAAWIWALDLSLAAFAALLFSETLFLALFTPAIALLARARTPGRTTGRVALAGVLFGAALLVREGAVLAAPFLLLWLATGPARGRAAATFALGALTIAGPWILRDAPRQTPLSPIAATAGANAYLGWNAYDVNFDLALLGERPTDDLRARLRGPAPEPWTSAKGEDARATLTENVTRGLAFNLTHPAFALRSRLVELVDLLSPTSYFVRQLRAVEGVGSPLATVERRRAAALLSLFAFPALALLALLGFATSAREHVRLRGLMAAVVLGAGAVVLINAVTRFRVPMAPALIVLAAVWLASPRAPRTRGERALVAFGACALCLAWVPSLGGLRDALAAVR